MLLLVVTSTVVMVKVLFAMGWSIPAPASFSSTRARFNLSRLFQVPTLAWKTSFYLPSFVRI